MKVSNIFLKEIFPWKCNMLTNKPIGNHTIKFSLLRKYLDI